MIVSGEADWGRLRALVLADLKRAGLKHRAKKHILKHVKDLKAVFGAPLHSVPLCSVNCCGSVLNVPVIISEIYSILKDNANVEGIFRKAGSQSRQKDIRRLLDSGGHISASHHPVDVASILKSYLRALPEPVISPEVQELLLRCRLAVGDAALCPKPGEDVMRPLLHTLMLLPVLHVHLLHYVMELLNVIASRHKENLMDATNLAIVMTPSIMPLPTTSQSAQRLEHHVALVKLFIEHSSQIGNLSEELMSQLDEENVELMNQARRKKRRSGSLNRVLNGLRKMVGGSERNPTTPARDSHSAKTPVISKSAAKRKLDAHEGLSAKTKKEIKKNLPQKELSFTPRKMGTTERKKLRLSMTRGTPLMNEHYMSNRESSISSEDLLTSSDNLFTTHDTIDLSDSQKTEKDYVKIPKQEFEEIKSRVSAIESRLSKEFTEVEPLQQVQNVYEQTLEDVAMLDYSSSDHLARRLSRELKIRQSDQNKIIRSPSARKIGTLRRRSKENVTKIVRHKSWNVSTHSQNADANRFYPYVGLKRGRPNTVVTGLPDVKKNMWTGSSTDNTPEVDDNDRCSYISRRQSARESNSIANAQPANRSDNGPNTERRWRNAATFFMERSGQNDNIAQTGRPSVNKLRAQNPGAVLAKAKIFESSSDRSSEKISNTKLPQSGFARRPRISGPQITKSNKQVPPVLKVKPNSARLIETAEPEPKAQRPHSSPGNTKGLWDFNCESKKSRKIITSPPSGCFSPPKMQRSYTSPTGRAAWDSMNEIKSRKGTSPVPNVCRSPQTPMIKKSLCVKSPRSYRTPLCTADSRRTNAPMRATHTSPQRRSPRLKAQRLIHQ